MTRRRMSAIEKDPSSAGARSLSCPAISPTKQRLALWKKEMPRREHFPSFLGGLPHVETQLHYPVLDGLGLLDPAVARAEMARIRQELEQELPGVRVSVHHRLGALRVGEAAVVCAASAPHRAEAFRACRLLIDRVKARVPIWKREHYVDGMREWVAANNSAPSALVDVRGDR